MKNGGRGLMMMKGVLGVAFALLLGCETGEEIAGVGSAVATRQADGRVSVAATMDCTLLWGMGRVDGRCDADDEEACVTAQWVERANPSNVVVTARRCKDIDDVRGSTIMFTSLTPIPTDRPLDIILRGDKQASAREGRTEVIIASP